ncbi:MAG TPA: hypothetical protein VI365_30035 [Trebonia sp.]
MTDPDTSSVWSRIRGAPWHGARFGLVNMGRVSHGTSLKLPAEFGTPWADATKNLPFG